MRIITGSARGVRLLTLPGQSTRPTSERTKEAVFSIIQFDIEGRRVLDLYAGSGQLALEALSRGASNAVLCDSSRQAIEIIKKNAARARLNDKCRIINGDAAALLQRLGKESFDLIFIDPPYAQRSIPEALRGLLANKLLKPTSLIICESGAPEDIFDGDEALAESFKVKKYAKYGVSHITILQPDEVIR